MLFDGIVFGIGAALGFGFAFALIILVFIILGFLIDQITPRA